MTVNHKVTGKAVSVPRGLALGVGISLAFTLLLSGILAKMVSMEKVLWNQVGYGIMAILFVASVFGAWAACAAIKRQKLVVSLSTGVLYWLSLLAITALFFGGQYHGIGVTGLTIFGGCGTVFLIGLGKRSRKEGRVHRKKYRSP